MRKSCFGDPILPRLDQKWDRPLVQMRNLFWWCIWASNDVLPMYCMSCKSSFRQRKLRKPRGEDSKVFIAKLQSAITCCKCHERHRCARPCPDCSTRKVKKTTQEEEEEEDSAKHWRNCASWRFCSNRLAPMPLMHRKAGLSCGPAVERSPSSRRSPAKCWAGKRSTYR